MLLEGHAELHPARRRLLTDLDDRYETNDLAAEMEALRAEDVWERTGRNAALLAKSAELIVVLTVMKANTHIWEHRAKGRVSVHALEGHLRLKLPERHIDLYAGHLVILAPGERHDVEALEDSAFLLTVAG